MKIELDVRIKAKSTNDLVECLDRFNRVFDEVRVTSRFKPNKEGQPGFHCFVILTTESNLVEHVQFEESR